MTFLSPLKICNPGYDVLFSNKSTIKTGTAIKQTLPPTTVQHSDTTCIAYNGLMLLYGFTMCANSCFPVLYTFLIEDWAASITPHVYSRKDRNQLQPNA